MIITIDHIHCSTASITIDDDIYIVCYWPDEGVPSRHICWVEVQKTKVVYAATSASPVSHLVQLFQHICDLNSHKFDENTCVDLRLRK